VQPELFHLEDQRTTPEALESLRALDELFHIAEQFSTRAAYGDLLRFIARFRMYSPFNASVITQKRP
jgi:hypothetical protein